MITTALEKKLLAQLNKAEALLADYQHGIIRETFPIRNYFSDHNRSVVIHEAQSDIDTF